MIYFFRKNTTIFAVQTESSLDQIAKEKLIWLFDEAEFVDAETLEGPFVGPRASMVTPWSTNAVEITQNSGIKGILRIELFEQQLETAGFDPMLLAHYPRLDQEIFTIHITPEPILEIHDIAAYNEMEGLALSPEEVTYLQDLSERLGRPLTDSEVFGFSQVNSEHCRHKIFNGTFIIDGEEMPSSLFKLIKKTSQENPNAIVSAYKDNVAFIKGPEVVQFAPKEGDQASYYEEKAFDSVISVKAETHNFPTTVEPFNGAATGSGGEIRDRLAGGQGSLPLAGTAVYMTAYSRLDQLHPWEKSMVERAWLYQKPKDILVKASNGASDFGNKFGQPLIAGSVLTFEHEEAGRKLGYDKVIMLAGGVGYGKENYSKKQSPQPGDKIVVLGGDNYRIGMGGAAVSSADTGAFGSGIELNAIQRSNPEMQKRVANAIRAVVESDDNIITSIHDHGAGGHLNCLSELVESTGGDIDLDKLPVGDPTLSAKEIIGNESQERMGLVVPEQHLERLQRIAERERAPMFVVGTVTGDERFTIRSQKTGAKPMDFALADMFGSSPKTIMEDRTRSTSFAPLRYNTADFKTYLDQVLQLEAVASKDWLTNKVDRCVGGRVAKQQCVGPLQLPLNNCGVMALDYKGRYGVATSIGHAPGIALIDERAGSRAAIAEALTNIIWAPLENGIRSVSLSANWMWACKNEGEDARLYRAVEACSDYAIGLGINIPTGKDSLSMKQKYPNDEVIAPGTVIISAGGSCDDIQKIVEPVLQRNGGKIYYLPFSDMQFELGGSSFAQILSLLGDKAPEVIDAQAFAATFDAFQSLIRKGWIQAGHDVGNGGLITTLLEMCFADRNLGAQIDLTALGESEATKVLFAENIGIVFQGDAQAFEALKAAQIPVFEIGQVISAPQLQLRNGEDQWELNIDELRDTWFRTSYLLDREQSGAVKAKERFDNYKNQPLSFKFPGHFDGRKPKVDPNQPRPKAAIIREKGSNSERELAQALFLAGFDVKDIHMTDLVSGRENLQDIQFLGAVGGFSNSDVLGSAKGWAGAFKYNEVANKAITDFFARKDTLSIGICNGCQLFTELGLLYPQHSQHPRMRHNDSHKHESIFTSLVIEDNHSVMFSSLAGSTIGVWVSHGEGKFELPKERSFYHIVGTYGYDQYPANPNGSDYNTGILCDESGRHVVTMPHVERSIFQWQWAYYTPDRKDEVTPWMEIFVNARKWIETQGK
jgi:phosphoribosylformylglycinamidine synthase